MSRVIKSWVHRVKPGRIDEAMQLFKEAKEAASEESGTETSVVYADSAGEYSGTFTFVASYPSGEAAGRANDAFVESEKQLGLWRKFHEADSPLEHVGTATYTVVDL